MNNEITKHFSLHFATDDGLWIVWTDRPILTFGSGENALSACANFFHALVDEHEFMSSSTLGERLQEEYDAVTTLINGFSEEDLWG